MLIMSNQSVSVEAICAKCGKTEYFRSETATKARELAFDAGWRDSSFGLCPDHAPSDAPDGSSAG
jgi:hypothetical protein